MDSLITRYNPAMLHGLFNAVATLSLLLALTLAATWLLPTATHPKTPATPPKTPFQRATTHRAAAE